MVRQYRTHSITARQWLKRAGVASAGCAISLSTGYAASCPAYDIVDLGALPGAQVSWASGLNSIGRVVGTSYVGETWLSPQHGFVHNGQQMVDIGTDGFSSGANAINISGQIAGSLSDGVDTRAVIWANGQTLDLGHLGERWAEAKDINDRGQAVGYGWLAGYSAQHAFLYRDGQLRDLGTLGGTYSYAEGINRWSEVVGGSTLSADGWDLYAFVWRNGRMQALGSFGCQSHYSFATDINDRSEIVGISHDDCGETVRQRGFLHRNGQLIDIGDLGGDDTRPLAINNAGQIVGYSLTASFDPAWFIWDRGTMRNLQQLIDPQTPWVLSGANDINDRGEIAGQAQRTDSNGDLVAHAILLRPRTQSCR